tara:strand:- start:309 stop:494 length:186 start_codon:yes stop_codon:yes gene_type:complete
MPERGTQTRQTLRSQAVLVSQPALAIKVIMALQAMQMEDAQHVLWGNTKQHMAMEQNPQSV